MINFPYPATNGQIYTTGTLIYVYNAAQQSWLTQPSSSATFTAVNITGNIASVSTTTGALTVAGGVGITGALYAGAIYSNGSLLGLSSNTTTNIAGGTTGSIAIQSGPGLTSFVPIGGFGTVLYSNGTTATWVAASSISSTTATNSNNAYVQQTSEDRNAGGIFYPVMVSAYDDYTPIDANGSLTWDDTNNILSVPAVTITATTGSTSTTTGALTVAGGVGIGGNLYVGGTITANQLTVKYTTITQTLVTSPDIFTITSTATSTSTNTGALVISGGVGVGGSVYFGNTLNVTGQTTLKNTTVTNFTATTAIILGNESVYGQLFVQNSTLSTSTNSGALQILGGIGVGGNINVGSYVTVQNGLYSINTFTGSYSDGIVVDYNPGLGATGSGRVSVGPNDVLSFYAGGPGGILLATFSTGTSIFASTAVTTSTTTGALTVAGGVGIGGNLYVGSTTTVNGSIIPSGNGLYDLGTPTARFRSLYVTSSTINIDGVLLSSQNGYLTAPGLLATGTFVSTSTTTGAIVITGGLGVGNNVYVGGTLNVTGQTTLNNTTVTNFTATSATILGNETIYGQALVANSTSATSTSTGALNIVGGVGIGGDLFVGGTINANKLIVQYTTVTQTQVTSPDIFTITNTTVSINTTTGALVVTGGVGIGGALNVGGTGTVSSLVVSGSNGVGDIVGVNNLSATGTILANTMSLSGTTTSTSTITGVLIVTGGVGIGGNVNIGGNVTGGGIRTTSTSTAPANPTVGDIWYNTSTDDIYRYTTDGVSSYWIDITGPLTSTGGNSLIPTGMSLVSTLTANNNTVVSFTGLNTYDKYLLMVEDAIPATQYDSLKLQVGTGSTPTYITSNYNQGYLSGLSSAAAGQLTLQSSIQLNAFTNSQNNTSVSGSSGVVWLTGFLGGRDMGVNGQFSQNGNSIEIDIFGGASSSNSTAKTAIKIFYGNGNISSGVFSLYGISS